MNFRTTIVLLVLLVGVGAYLLFTRDRAGGPSDTVAVPPAHTVTDVKSADVDAVTVDGADGRPVLAIEKAGGGWRVTKPFAAAADSFKATSLVDDLTTNLKSTSVVKAAGPDAPQTGVGHPQYTVAVMGGGKTTTLAVGDRLSVGDGVYAQVTGSDSVDVVPASLLDTLARPASDLRKTQLFDVSSADVQQLTITHKDGSQLALAKTAGTWRVLKPTPMAADATAVDGLLATIINLTPVSFVDDPADAVGLAHPADVISFSTAAPTTQPAASQPVATVVKIGGYDDVQKKNVFAALPDGTVVKLAASVLDTLHQTPLDLRDRTVADVDPAKVTTVTIAVETAATTQPAAKPAVTKTVVLTRRPPKPAVMGPALGTTKPATAPAAAAQSTWVLTSDGSADADDAKVATLLADFHPLKADKFLAASAVTNPARRLTITLAGGAAPVVVHIADPGHDLSPVGTYDGLTFDLPTTSTTDVTADFKKAAAVAAMP